jgi:predicted transcriptional regulator
VAFFYNANVMIHSLQSVGRHPNCQNCQNVDKMTEKVDKMTEKVDKMTENVNKMTKNVDLVGMTELIAPHRD